MSSLPLLKPFDVATGVGRLVRYEDMLFLDPYALGPPSDGFDGLPQPLDATAVACVNEGPSQPLDVALHCRGIWTGEVFRIRTSRRREGQELGRRRPPDSAARWLTDPEYDALRASLPEELASQLKAVGSFEHPTVPGLIRPVLEIQVMTAAWQGWLSSLPENSVTVHTTIQRAVV
ncbi:hypothetical protein IPV09_09165 [Tessaracoccus sp. SD287]|uniref:hypothetical protein n=1 Tax=Tessaracoccus sp. SD287 TaxID=2782008 RepID=UPI001A96A982|nr:hypothetical protein [Tessaracoccus sp. SD287]MBO1031503.1 hypothetical protein [Tessaracoccus sp. SD287]